MWERHCQSQPSSESQLGDKQGCMSLAVGRSLIGCPMDVLGQGKLTVQLCPQGWRRSEQCTTGLPLERVCVFLSWHLCVHLNCFAGFCFFSCVCVSAGLPTQLTEPQKLNKRMAVLQEKSLWRSYE